MGCFEHRVTHDDENVAADKGQGELATDGLHLGAIKAPGADAGMEFVAGVADPGNVGEATLAM